MLFSQSRRLRFSEAVRCELPWVAVHLTAINDLADVESVLEQMGQRSRAEATPVKLLYQGARGFRNARPCVPNTRTLRTFPDLMLRWPMHPQARGRSSPDKSRSR